MDTTHRKSESVELVLARLLRVGTMIAAVTLGVGTVMTLLGTASGVTVITAGLIVLVSTPVLRVAVAMLVFLREKDWLFAAFCVFVLLSLVGGMVIGHME
ncbi:MAG TPA: DUF1634 domain-containing protein [Symbiobacteriaceae bacterium]|jgi:uncharacterized membrane protein|nr:DUF1634 domain-containing protein [Symbiobacteriaceae bacterium]